MSDWAKKTNSHDLWLTPPELFSVLDKEFQFDLDAAASFENALYPVYITEQQNALTTPWIGRSVWCNPPYSLIGPFVKRAYEESLEQKNTVVILIPTYTDPKYWRDYVTKAHEIRHLVGRIQFIDGNNPLGKKCSARFPSTVVVFKHIKGMHYGKGPAVWSWDWRVE